MSVASGDLTVEVAGERLVLLPERAAFWPRRATLLVADAHFGKAATFRAAGLPVPAGTSGEGLARLDAMLERMDARRIVFLGDLLHAREGRAPRTLDALASWRRRHAAIDVLLVRGNHDRRAGDPPAESGIACVDPPLPDVPFSFVHHPSPAEGAYVLAGHLHPGIRVQGAGGLRAQIPCFWFGVHVGVLPAFGGFTGMHLVEPAPGDQVFGLAGDALVEIDALRAGGDRQ